MKLNKKRVKKINYKKLYKININNFEKFSKTYNKIVSKV